MCAEKDGDGPLAQTLHRAEEQTCRHKKGGPSPRFIVPNANVLTKKKPEEVSPVEPKLKVKQTCRRRVRLHG